jgi:hypothetical protein
MPSRIERYSKARRNGADLAAARQVAIHFVASRWPELAEVAPDVTLLHDRHHPSPELIARLGLNEVEIVRPAPDTTAYTFTFAIQRRVADGVVAPLVAAVTVNHQQHIVKTSLSK